MLKRMWFVYGSLRRGLGLRFAPLLFVPYFATLRTVVAVSMALDRVFVPRLRRTRIERPIVIVGNPRTGTTQLHRFMHEHGLGSGAELWGLLYPSVLLRRIVRPLLPRLEAISPAKHHSSVIHETSLTSIETDEPAVSLRFFDGPFVAAFLGGWSEADPGDRFDTAGPDKCDRDVRWLDEVWRRNLVYEDGDRVLAKLFSLSVRLPRFLEHHPDAKLLYTVRDPVDAAPSMISMLTSVADQAFGFWERPEAVRQRYMERLYLGFVELLRGFHADYVAGRIPSENLLLVHYDRMMNDFEGVMDEILAFVEITPDEALKRTIAERAERQRAYRSGHRYDLTKFGLSEERIRSDCAFFYETFGLDRGDEPTPARASAGT